MIMEYIRYTVADVRPFFDDIREMRHHEATAVRGTGSGGG